MADQSNVSNLSAMFSTSEDVCHLEEFNSCKDILLGKFINKCSNNKKPDLEKNYDDSK